MAGVAYLEAGLWAAKREGDSKPASKPLADIKCGEEQGRSARLPVPSLPCYRPPASRVSLVIARLERLHVRIVSHRVVLGGYIMVGHCATVARTAPIDDCDKARGTAALSSCSQVVDNGKEKPATRAFARLLRARAELDMSDLDRAEADISAALALTPNATF